MSAKTEKVDSLNTPADRKHLKKRAARKDRRETKKATKKGEPEEAPKKRQYLG